MSNFARYLDAELNTFLSRSAQFGGRGGSPQSWMPGAGGGAMGHEGRVGKGGQNDFSSGMGLDQIMGRTRRNTEDSDVPDINIERWLEGSHSDVENDRRGYDLTQEERKTLDLREKIRRREQFLAKLLDHPGDNPLTPKKFKDGSRPEQHQTLESTLENRHENDDKVYSDQAAPQIQPERTFGYASINYHRMLRLAQKSIFDQNSDGDEFKRTHTSTEATPNIKANEEVDPLGAEAVSKKMPALGKMSTTVNPAGIPTSESDFEHALRERPLDDAGKNDLGMASPDGIWGERTLAFDHPGADEIGDHSAGNVLTKDMFADQLDAFINDEPDEKSSDSGTLEEQLEESRPRRKFRIQDIDRLKGFSETEAKHLTDPNFPNVPWGAADFYNGGAFADHGVPLPKV